MSIDEEEPAPVPKPLQRATMRDVAALAEVSPKTVSRVIHGEKYVSEEIAERVRAAMLRLTYRPNLGASQLRVGSTSGAIGLILVDISNPFSSAIHRAIEDVFRNDPIVVLAASTDEEAVREQEAVAAFTARRVDGLIIMPASHDHSYLAAEVAAGTHIVLVDRPPVQINVDSVVSENHAGAREGVHHLIRHGHHRVGFIGDWPNVVSSQLRYDGYLAALGDAGLSHDPSLALRGFENPDEIEKETGTLLQAVKPPTALFVAQNALCAPVIRAVRSMGLQRKIAIVGFDGFDGADLIEPGLTVVAQDPVLMGTIAANMLLDRMNGAQKSIENVVLPTYFLKRGSGEILNSFSGTKH